MANIIERQTVKTIQENLEVAQQDVRQAFLLLQQAKERMQRTFGGAQHTYTYESLWSHTISDYDLERTSREITDGLERKAWKYVVELLGIRAFMTPRRQEELDKQLSQGKLPPFTVETALSTLEGFTSQAADLLKESAREVFQWLCPGREAWRPRYKTNQTTKIGKKVIVSGVETEYGGGFKLNYYRQKEFRALGNVFSLLDGTGAQKYPEDLVTQLNAGLRELGKLEHLNWVSTPYLDCKPYRNGNAHLTFTRQDLLDQLNALGSDGSLAI